MNATPAMSPAKLQETLDLGARHLYDVLKARSDEPTASRDDVLVAEAAMRHWQSLAAVAALIEREAALVAERESLRKAVGNLIDFAESALDYVDKAAAAVKESHKVSGHQGSLVIAEAVASGLRSAIEVVRAEARNV